MQTNNMTLAVFPHLFFLEIKSFIKTLYSLSKLIQVKNTFQLRPEENQDICVRYIEWSKLSKSMMLFGKLT